MEERKEFLLVKDVAEILEMQERTVLKFIKDGELKAKKVGNKYILTRNQLREFIEG